MEAIYNIGKVYVAQEIGLDISNQTDNDRLKNLGFKELLKFISIKPFDLDNFTERSIKGTGPIDFPRLLVVKLASKESSARLEFQGIDSFQYDEEFDEKIIAFPASGGAYSTPTIKVYPEKKGSTPEDKIRGGVLKYYKNILKFFNAAKKRISSFDEVYELLQSHKESITDHLVDRCLQISQDKTNFNIIVTITIDNKFPKEHPDFLSFFKEKFIVTMNKFDQSWNKGGAEVCSICHKKSGLLSGHASPYSFYTADKSGYVAGGFDAKKMDKNFPLCESCSLYLAIGKNYIDQNLNFILGGIRYLLIPKPLADIKSLKQFFIAFKDERENLESRKSFQALASDENLIFSILRNKKDQLLFTFLFYELVGPGNSVFNILLEIADILPSRINIIAKAIRNTDSFESNPKIFGTKPDKYPLGFSFYNLRKLFTTGAGRTTFDRDAYLQFIWLLMTGGSINFKRLLNRFYSSLKISISKSENVSASVIVAQGVYNFIPIYLLLKELNQVKY